MALLIATFSELQSEARKIKMDDILATAGIRPVWSMLRAPDGKMCVAFTHVPDSQLELDLQRISGVSTEVDWS